MSESVGACENVGADEDVGLSENVVVGVDVSENVREASNKVRIKYVTMLTLSKYIPRIIRIF